MTDDITTLARQWLSALAVRNISCTIRGNKLQIVPATAYRFLTDDELIFLRHHREEIKALVDDGDVSDVPTAETKAPSSNYGALFPRPPFSPRSSAEPTPAPPCPFCSKSPTDCDTLRRTRADLWRVFHARHPDEVKRRRDEATAVMYHQIGKT
jgi:hypothetical protein